MLGVLRSDEPADALLPQPTLDHLDGLVHELRDAGLPTELRIEGTPRTLPAGVDVNAYRIVQEALTNVLKHGGAAAHASVRVRYDPRSLVLEISDDGQGAAAAVLSRGDGGQGLLGMRERVLLHGGELEAGPRMSGGFRVLARLPIEDAPTVEESSALAPDAQDLGSSPAPPPVSSPAPAPTRALPPTPATDPPA
jgi:signal transduction histidine kinase